jgi:hypothetical protein
MDMLSGPAVRLGQRERHANWLGSQARRGLRPPWRVISDRAPGLIGEATNSTRPTVTTTNPGSTESAVNGPLG